MKYDVAIVGAGPAGLFAAYELITKNKLFNKNNISFSLAKVVVK